MYKIFAAVGERLPSLTAPELEDQSSPASLASSFLVLFLFRKSPDVSPRAPVSAFTGAVTASEFSSGIGVRVLVRGSLLSHSCLLPCSGTSSF